MSVGSWHTEMNNLSVLTHKYKYEFIYLYMKGQHITLFIDVGPQIITMGCLEFNPNLRHPVQLFVHLTIIFWGPTKQKLNIE